MGGKQRRKRRLVSVLQESEQRLRGKQRRKRSSRAGKQARVEESRAAAETQRRAASSVSGRALDQGGGEQDRGGNLGGFYHRNLPVVSISVDEQGRMLDLVFIILQ